MQFVHRISSQDKLEYLHVIHVAEGNSRSQKILLLQTVDCANPVRVVSPPEDIHNEKIFRVRYEEQSELDKLRATLGCEKRHHVWSFSLDIGYPMISFQFLDLLLLYLRFEQTKLWFSLQTVVTQWWIFWRVLEAFRKSQRSLSRRLGYCTFFAYIQPEQATWPCLASLNVISWITVASGTVCQGQGWFDHLGWRSFLCLPVWSKPWPLKESQASLDDTVIKLCAVLAGHLRLWLCQVWPAAGCERFFWPSQRGEARQHFEFPVHPSWWDHRQVGTGSSAQLGYLYTKLADQLYWQLATSTFMLFGHLNILVYIRYIYRYNYRYILI